MSAGLGIPEGMCNNGISLIKVISGNKIFNRFLPSGLLISLFYI
jgi:hypothetical protein